MFVSHVDFCVLPTVKQKTFYCSDLLFIYDTISYRFEWMTSCNNKHRPFCKDLEVLILQTSTWLLFSKNIYLLPCATLWYWMNAHVSIQYKVHYSYVYNPQKMLVHNYSITLLKWIGMQRLMWTKIFPSFPNLFHCNILQSVAFVHI